MDALRPKVSVMLFVIPLAGCCCWLKAWGCSLLELRWLLQPTRLVLAESISCLSERDVNEVSLE